MFEKEAKERARDFTENEEKQVAYECGFLDGADRMRAEMQKQGLVLQSDMDKTIEQNITLKSLVEKMKCCQNCLHLCGLCKLGIKDCYVCSKWEVRR